MRRTRSSLVFRASSACFRSVMSSESAIVPYPDKTAIFPAVLLLDLKLLSFSFQQFPNQGPVSLAVVLMSNLEKGNRLEFLLRITQHFLVSGVCGQEVAIQISERNANGRILKDRSPPLLTLPQGLLRSLTLR